LVRQVVRVEIAAGVVPILLLVRAVVRSVKQFVAAVATTAAPGKPVQEAGSKVRAKQVRRAGEVVDVTADVVEEPVQRIWVLRQAKI
jgi:hypothetical protein